MNEFRQKSFSGERALFDSKGLKIYDCTFENGESPLKECRDIELYGALFKWKYPLWYCKNVKSEHSIWFENARAGVWYTDNIEITDSLIQAPKNFRRCKGIKLDNVTMTDAKETLWSCENVTINNSSAKGDYFAMNSRDMEISGFTLDGNYAFDGAENITIKDSRLLTKDAFWNSSNVTVKNSFISGEYLGWNSKNLTLIDCTVESLQGMCYIDNLVMKNCRLLNTTLAFEYSSVDVDITSSVDSVFNPGSGTIRAEKIGELIVEKDKSDPEKTLIICNNIEKKSDRPEWLR